MGARVILRATCNFGLGDRELLHGPPAGAQERVESTGDQSGDARLLHGEP